MSEHYCMYKDGMCELDIDEAYQQGYADALDIDIDMDMDKPMYFTNEQKAWVKDCIISNGLACYERGAREFAEWLAHNRKYNPMKHDVGFAWSDEAHFSTVDEIIAEWQKGADIDG